MSTFLKLALPAAVLLAGCTSTGAPMSPASDRFAVNNFQEQVVDPAPAEGAPEMDAAMSAAAIERYRTGKTKKAAEDSEAGVSISIAPGK